LGEDREVCGVQEAYGKGLGEVGLGEEEVLAWEGEVLLLNLRWV